MGPLATLASITEIMERRQDGGSLREWDELYDQLPEGPQGAPLV